MFWKKTLDSLQKDNRQLSFAVSLLRQKVKELRKEVTSRSVSCAGGSYLKNKEEKKGGIE